MPALRQPGTADTAAMSAAPHAGNIASVSWPDHLVFGEGHGALDTPEALRLRMAAWRDELNVTTVHWREVRSRSREGRYYGAPGNPRTHARTIASIEWDDFEVVPRLAHEAGLKAHLYVSVLDDGRPLPPKRERARSYHNAMHAQHVTWQTDWSRAHPEYAMVDRSGMIRQWGVPCYAYPAVRAAMRERIERYIDGTEFDGVFVCTRSQAKPALHADQFGFNEPARRDYLERYGVDILRSDFELPRWHDLLGSYFTQFLRELRAALNARAKTLSIGVPRGDVIGPPLGNWTLEWRTWIRDGLIDELIINQNSSQCPSMWHQLWPMHRGYGYIQPCEVVRSDVREQYAPLVTAHQTGLYIARQWDERDPAEDVLLSGESSVTGLVYSTFRFDNPAAIRRGNFEA